MGQLPGPRNPAVVVRLARRFVERPDQALLELHGRYGEVAALGPGSMRHVFMFGPAANEYILADNVNNFRWRDGFKTLIPLSGETALVVSDGEPHRRRRRLVSPAFSTAHVRGYLPSIADEVRQMIDIWKPGEQRDVFADFRLLVVTTIVRCLFGETLAQHSPQLLDDLDLALKFVGKPPTRQVRVDLPGTPYRKMLRARQRVDSLVYDELTRRRMQSATTDGRDDLLTWLMEAGNRGEASLTTEELRDQVVSLSNGFDTTSAALAWVLYALLQHPSWLEAARVEMQALGDGPDADALLAAPVLDAVVMEALRLWPPVLMAPRGAIDAFEFGGHLVPAGSKIIYSPFVTHRMAALWEQPDEFRPQRWSHNGDAANRPSPYAFLPFGGGYRRCIGSSMGVLIVKATLGDILRRTDLVLESRGVVPAGISSSGPRDGLRVSIKART